MEKKQHSEYDIQYYIQHLKAFTAIAVLNIPLNSKKDQENTLKQTKNLLNAVFKKLTSQKEAFTYNHMFLSHAPSNNRLADNHVCQLLFRRLLLNICIILTI